MRPRYEIVEYQPSMKSEVAELAKYLWSKDSALNASYLEWKYERNPYRNPPLIYLAACEGRIVGMRGMFGVKWECGVPAKAYPGLYPDDFVIVPEHRNRGLVTEIMKEALAGVGQRGYSYVFNLSAGNVTRMASLAMGWRSAGTMGLQSRQPEQAERFRNIREFAKNPVWFRNLARKIRYRPWAPKRLAVDDVVTDHKNCFRNTDPNILIERVPRAEEMGRLIARIGHDGRIRHVRDNSYFSWRFQNPLHRYLFLYWKETELEGYLVLQEYVSDMMKKVGFNIVDWEATSAHVRAGLLRAAVGLCSSTVLNVWGATLPVETRNLLKESGFRALEETSGVEQNQPYLLVRPVQEDMLREEWLLGDQRLLDMSHWDIRMIYSLRG